MFYSAQKFTRQPRHFFPLLFFSHARLDRVCCFRKRGEVYEVSEEVFFEGVCVCGVCDALSRLKNCIRSSPVVVCVWGGGVGCVCEVSEAVFFEGVWGVCMR